MAIQNADIQLFKSKKVRIESHLDKRHSEYAGNLQQEKGLMKRIELRSFQSPFVRTVLSVRAN